MAGDILKFIIEVDEATATAKLTRFRQGLKETGDAAAAAGQKSLDSMDQVQSRMTAFGATMTSLGRTLSLGLTAPILAIGGFGIAFNSMQEQAQVAFTTILHSASAAKTMISDLKDFAARTPFQFPELVQATQRLIAMGVEAGKTHGVLVAIGDAAAAMGGGAEKIGVLTHAIGQMAATGRVTGRETMELAMAGVNAYKILAEGYGTTVENIRKQTEKGAINSKEAIDILVAGIEKQFAGMMEKQSKTFQGLFSTIADESRFLAGALTEGLFNAIKGPAEEVIDVIHRLRITVEALPDSFKASIAGIAIALAALGPGLIILGTLSNSIGNILKLVMLIGGSATWAGFVGGLAAVGTAAGVVGIALAGLYLEKRALEWAHLEGVMHDTGAEFVKLLGNLPTLTHMFADLAKEIFGAAKAMASLTIPDWLKDTAKVAALVQLMQIQTGLKTLNAIAETNQPPGPIPTSNAGLPAAAQQALAANEARMRTGVPIPVAGGGHPTLDSSAHDFAVQVDEMVKSVMKEANASAILDAALKQLTASHVPLAVIADKLGKQIKDNAEMVGLLGGKVSEARQKILDFMAAQEMMDRGNKQVSETNHHAAGQWIDLMDAIVQATEGVEIWDNRVGMMVGGIDATEAAVNAANEAMEQHNKILHQMGEELAFVVEQRKLVRDLILAQPSPGFMIGGVSGTQARQQAIATGTIGVGKEINDLQELPHVLAGILDSVRQSDPGSLNLAYKTMSSEITAVEDVMKHYNITLTAQEKATLSAAIATVKATESSKKFEEAMGVAMGQIMADLIVSIVKAAAAARGLKAAVQSILDTAISGLGQKMGELIALAMARPLLERFTKLGEQIAKVFDKLGDKIGDVIGKGLGDKLGKTIGKLLGDVVGGLVGVAIGATIGAISNAIGKGRRTANEFVQGSQNAFGRELGTNVNDFWQQVGAGTLTKGEGMQAREQVAQMWADFQQSAMEFAAKGGTEAKVAMQALATLSPIVAKNLEDMDGAIGNLGDTAKKTAIEFETAVEGMLNSITSFADNADVLEETIHRAVDKGVPMALIIDALGNTITKTVSQLNALGIDVPPWIAAAAHEMEQLGNAVEKASTQFEDAVQRILGSITSFADNADVLNEAIHRAVDKNVPMSLIVDALGSDVQSTVKQLTALGKDVPPWIKLVADAMDKLGNSAETAAKKLQKGLSVEDLVKAEISAYNAGFEVGRVTRGTNAYRYVTPNMPAIRRGVDDGRTTTATATAAPSVTVNITEGDMSFRIEPGMSAEEIMEKFRSDIANNRKNLKTFLAKTVKDAWKAEGRPF